MHNNNQAKLFYEKNFKHYEASILQITKQIKKYTSLRIGWFVGGIVVLYFVSVTNWIWFSLALVLYLLGFVFIVVKHGQWIQKKKEALVYRELFLNEKEALQGNYSAFADGKEFSNPQHPYATDLDIFGQTSIFQLLNRTFSKSGKEDLANLLQGLEQNAENILQRQEAIIELAKKPEWIFQFRALGTLAYEKESAFSTDPNDLVKALSKWIKKPNIFLKTHFKIMSVALPLISLLVFVLLLMGEVSFSFFVFYLFLPLGYTGAYAKQINQQHVELSKQSNVLLRFQKVFEQFENEKFSGKTLLNLQSKLKSESSSASQSLKKLVRISQAFDTRLNVFAWLFLNYFLLWDVRQSMRLEKWKKSHHHFSEKAFGAVAQMETLVSFAVFYYNRTDLVFPTIETERFCVDGKSMGHPLIDPEKRVDNDVHFCSAGQFFVITGANMAGKSTYLRTVGVNLILALAGAPVCAKAFKTSLLKPFTSIKTSDSLANNESYFYAELLRLQRIIEALKTGDPYFIILDEILKGTNSKDKEQGSKALVKKLIGLQASGIIATHDLQLAELSRQFPENVKTACFEVDIKNDQLSFDYTLREGVSQNLNATFLMKKLGIS